MPFGQEPTFIATSSQTTRSSHIRCSYHTVSPDHLRTSCTPLRTSAHSPDSMLSQELQERFVEGRGILASHEVRGLRNNQQATAGNAPDDDLIDQRKVP